MDKREHSIEVLPECVQIFNRIEEKLDNLVTKADKINGRYDEHLAEAIPYRGKVDMHDNKFCQMEAHRRWLIGLQVSTLTIIVLQIVGFVYLWGQLTKTVEINTGRITGIEFNIDKLHPRTVK